MGLIARAKDVQPNPGGVDGPAAQCSRQLEPILLGTGGGTLELRAFNVTRKGSSSPHTEVSHYPSTSRGLKQFARDAVELSTRAEGVYFVLNPLPADLSHNAKDVDVLRRCWLPIDVDPTRPEGMKSHSATDREKQHAWLVVTAIRRWLTEELGWPRPILADSGNGYHLLYRVDLPVESDLVRDLIHALHARFSVPEAEVDLKVVNPSRLWKAYGTMARKGYPKVPNTEDRPYRLAQVLEQPGELLAVSDQDLEQAIARLGNETRRGRSNGKHQSNGEGSAPAPKPRKRKGIIARAVDPEDNLDRARAYLETCDPAISGQGGHGTTYRVACEVGPGFGLDPDDCLKLLLEHYNPRCQPPWSEKELRHKVDQAYSKDKKPRGHHLEEEGKRGPGRPRKAPETPVIEDPETGRLETFDDPHRLARLYVSQRHTHSEGLLIRYWDEQWHTWDGQCWGVRKEREIHAELTALIKSEFDRVAAESGQPAKSVGTRLLGNVAQALRGETLLTLGKMRSQPAWLDLQEGDHAPLEYLPVLNGLAHLPTLVDLGPEDPGVLRKLTPRYFSPSVLGYAFDGRAPAPERWLEFLGQLWPEDPDAILCVQEWFGYLLTLDTSFQKILLLVGPRRSGKGTLTRILIRLVGTANHRAPTLSSLATPFGLEALIGRQLAVVPEARISGRSDTQAIVERLLSISGEDPQTIPRKYLTDWHGQLFTRFVLLGNELPRLGDQSGALASRLVILRLERSFLGHEDLGLMGKLEPELPGILLWAIEGLRRLREQRRFTIPESSKEIIEEFEKLSSPVGAFVEDCCDLGTGFRVLVGDLYQAWTKWCDDNGRDHPGDTQAFGRSLRAAIPRLKVTQPREGGDRVRYYLGIKLRTQPDDPDAPF